MKFNLMAVSKATGPANPPVYEFKRGDPWLDDGSVILQAQSTFFKVHRSVLARNAEIFADTFQMPQPDTPADEQVVIDGCPVLSLTDDPTELGHFLRALYDGQKYFAGDVILPFEAITGLVRLGTKYEASHLREEGMRRLPAVADSLLTCDEFSNSPRELYKRKCAVVLANLAETHELDAFLPPALYACCQISDTQLRSGLVDKALCDSEKLLPINVERVLMAKGRLASHTEQIITDMTATLGYAKACRRARSLNRAQCWDRVPSSVAAWNPHRWLQVWIDDVEKAWVCSPMCLMNAKAFKNKKSEEIRERLRVYFELSEANTTARRSGEVALPSCPCASS